MAQTIKGRGVFVAMHDANVFKATELNEFTLNAQPKDDEVLVKFMAAPLNPSDIYCINGAYAGLNPCPFVVGFEGVGEILKKGKAVKILEVGDWVLPAVPKFGTWRTHCMVPQRHVMKIDKKIGFKAAATNFLNPYTAYLLLNDVVNLKAGDVVLQNAANSTVGQALIQFAKDKGIKTINVIRKREAGALAALKKQLQDLGADCVLTDEEIKNRGKDDAWPNKMPKPKLVIDCVGGEPGTDLVRHLPQGGTYVNYGLLTGQPITVSPIDLIFNDIKVVGLWITKMLADHPERGPREIAPYIAKLIQQKKFKAPECELFLLDDYEKALKRSIDGYSNVKQLLVMDEALMK